MGHYQKSFTLVELLVVISIISLLASIVLVSLNSARLRARDARRLSDVRQLRSALELYFDRNNSSYPNTLGSLVPTFISTVPQNPSGASSSCSSSSGGYCYVAYGTGCTAYHLGATLEDSSNTALDSDADVIAQVSGVCGGAVDFSGQAVATCGGAAGQDRCYDVRP